MDSLKAFFASPAGASLPPAGEVAAAVGRYGWFAPVRVMRELQTGDADPQLALFAPWRGESSLRRAAVDAEALTRLSSEEVIDRFLREEDLRIVADDGAPDCEVRTAPELDDEDEIVSEELAAIYLSQGLRGEAHSDLSQIKFAKSRKKCLLCRTYRQN